MSARKNTWSLGEIFPTDIAKAEWSLTKPFRRRLGERNLSDLEFVDAIFPNQTHLGWISIADPVDGTIPGEVSWYAANAETERPSSPSQMASQSARLGSACAQGVRFTVGKASLASSSFNPETVLARTRESGPLPRPDHLGHAQSGCCSWRL